MMLSYYFSYYYNSESVKIDDDNFSNFEFNKSKSFCSLGVNAKELSILLNEKTLVESDSECEFYYDWILQIRVMFSNN